MPNILIQKDGATLIAKTVTDNERRIWMMDFAIYDVAGDGSKSGPFGPTRARVTSGGLSMNTLGEINVSPAGAAFSDGIAPLRPSPYRANRNPVVLYEGDSITARGDSGASGSFPNSAFTGFSEGLPTASEAGGYQDAGYVLWERIFSHGCFISVNNAVSGNTISQVRSRMLATDLSAFDAVSLMVGTNDVPGASGAAQADTDILSIIDIVSYVGAAGRPLRILLVPPRNSTSWTTAAQRDYWRKFNHNIKKLPSTYPWVFVADSVRAISDATAGDQNPTPASNMLAESGVFTGSPTHPSKLGAYSIAVVSWPALEAALRWAGFGHVIDSRRTVDLGGAEQLTNTDFVTQTGGTAPAGALTGTIPSGWRVISAIDVASSFPWHVPEAKRQRGNWVTSTAYAAGDGVTESGNAYLCLAAHTSGTFATDLAAGDWVRVWAYEYCWQLSFTASAADQVVDIRRVSQPTFRSSQRVMASTYVATENASNIKRFDLSIFGNVTEASSFTRTLSCPGSQLMGGILQSTGGRIEGFVSTPKAALTPNFTTAAFVTNIPGFRLNLSSVAAGVMTVIIWRPSFRNY